MDQYEGTGKESKAQHEGGDLIMELIRGKQPKAIKLLVYGPEGIGKSTFASHFPNPVFIDTEGGTDYMDVARTPKPTSWTMLLEQVRYFIQHPNELGTLVIDTVDWAEKLCIEQLCASKQMKGIEDFGYGRGYVYLAEEFGKLLNALEELRNKGIHIVLTAHATLRKFEQPDELGSYDRWELKLGKKTAPLCKEWADTVLHANYKTYVVNVDNQGVQKGKNKAQGGHRVMHTTHHPCWDAKNRQGLKEELPFDFKEIAHCISSGAPRQETPPPAPKAQTFPPVEEKTPASPPPAEDTGSAPEQQQLYTGSFPPTEENPIHAKPPLDEAIPKALRDLMEKDLVTEEEVQEAVAKRGYYPADTPIRNYEADFIQGVLIAAWPQIFKFIEENVRDLPF